MSSPFASLRVLVIDDHAVIRRTLKVVLGGLGITDIEEADSVDAAEQLLRNAPAYDVIFCDLNLPGRDGIELLRGMPGLAGRTAIILLSGEDERILRSVAAMGRASGLHVLAAISKPATAQKISTALARLDETVPMRRTVAAEPVVSGEQFDEMLAAGMLSLQYQPKVRVADGELVGVEALLRGKHPTLGQVPPSAIVAAAVGADRVGALTRFVLQSGIAAAGRFHKEGLKISVALNVDAKSLGSPRLPDVIADLAQEHDVPMAAVSVEIDESQIFDDYVRALDVTTRLRLKRCHLCIDNFGTGPSGLRDLVDLPFSEMKISRRYIAGCAGDLAHRAITQAAIGLARAFDMKTVAVGVETDAEWEVVKSLGVDMVQGFMVSKPLAEVHVADWMGEWAMRGR